MSSYTIRITADDGPYKGSRTRWIDYGDRTSAIKQLGATRYSIEHRGGELRDSVPTPETLARVVDSAAATISPAGTAPRVARATPTPRPKTPARGTGPRGELRKASADVTVKLTPRALDVIRSEVWRWDDDSETEWRLRPITLWFRLRRRWRFTDRRNRYNRL